MSDAFHQSRICVTLRILVDVDRDWMQRTVTVTGVEEGHLLGQVVHHPEPFRELPTVMARQLLDLVDEVRTATGTRPLG